MIVDTNILVLIAADDYLFTKALEELVTAMGNIVVGTAGTGREALAMAATLRPDVVLVEPELADMSGQELARLVQSRTLLPVVFVTDDSLLGRIARMEAGAATSEPRFARAEIQQAAQLMRTVAGHSRGGGVPRDRRKAERRRQVDAGSMPAYRAATDG